MKKIIISELELFSSLIELTINNSIIDLHNNFLCYNIIYSKKENSLSLFFFDLKENKIKLIFKEVEFHTISLDFEKTNSFVTIDNFYRGRFEKDGKLMDISSEGKGFIYIEFYEGHTIDFFAKELLITTLDVD